VTRAEVVMGFAWLSLSNPVAVWWCFLVAVSAANVALWFGLYRRYRNTAVARQTSTFLAEPLVWLSAAYVFGCAFRSILPRADVQRICLFNDWISSVVVGRSVATVAEVCFVIQWAIVLRALANLTHSDTAKAVSNIIVPLIVVAEACSWYAVITTNYLGNVLENSLWTLTFLLIGVALSRLIPRFRGPVQWTIAAAAAGIACYVVFMATVDVPMYFDRWQADVADGKSYLGLVAGLHDVAARWTVTHDIAQWRQEIPWMSLYFSMAVWASLALGSFGLLRHLLLRHRVSEPVAKPTRQPVAVPIKSRPMRY